MANVLMNNEIGEISPSLTIIWRIENFLNLNFEVHDNFVCKSFEFDQCCWHIRLLKKNSRKCHSVFINADANVISQSDVIVTLAFITNNGTLHGKRHAKISFSHVFVDFINIACFECMDTELLSDSGMLSLILTMERENDCYFQKRRNRASLSEVALFSDRVKNFYCDRANSIYHDLKICCNGKKFSCSSHFLHALSPSFLEYITNVSYDSDNFAILNEFDPDALEVFFVYIHSGKIENLKTIDAINLYIIANKFSNHEIKKFCAETMTIGLNNEFFSEIAVISYKYNEKALFDFMQDYFISHFHEIIESPSWVQLLSNHAGLGNLLLKKMSHNVKIIPIKKQKVNPYV